MSIKKTPAGPDLRDLREKIDAVDEKLLALLAQRSRLVNQVAQAKRDSGQTHILRPAREAQQMRKFLDWHSHNAGDMPLSGFQAVWREIISSSVSQQKPLTVFCAGTVFDAAKAQFGQAAQYMQAGDASALFANVVNTPHAIGVADLQVDGFLPQLYTIVQERLTPAVRIFLCLPLFQASAQIFCFGQIPAEPSGEDRTLLIGPVAALPSNAEELAAENGIGLAMMDGFVTQEALHPSAQEGGVFVCGSYPLFEERLKGQV
ncbi:MAG: chorismate mutase [Parvibaculales bacterium]